MSISTNTTSSRWVPFLAAAVLALAVFATYSNTFRVPLLLDDVEGIARNTSLNGFKMAFCPPTGITTSGRPVANATFALNRAVSGEALWSYHAANVVIHLVTALTLFGIVRRTVRRSANRLPADQIGFMVALIWALHPLQTEAVAYLSQRVESLAAMFSLLTLYTFTRAAESLVPAQRVRWEIGSVIACGLGMASKETAVGLPLLVWLYDRTFWSGGFRASWRARRIYYLFLASTWIALAWCVASAGGRGGSAGFSAGVSGGQYLLTQADAIVRYLRLTFWPTGLTFDYGFWIAHRIAEVWWQLLLLIAAAAVTVWALWRKPVAGFVGAWFFLWLAPSSSFVPIASQTIAEHRMYLALAAPVLAVALGVLAPLRRVGLAAGLALAVALGIGSFERNSDYRSAIALWRDTLVKRPDNPRAYSSLAHAYAEAGRWDDAIAMANRQLALAPNYRGDADEIIGRALLELGRPGEAIPHFAAALRRNPAEFDVHNNYGMALAALGRRDEAVRQYREALRIRPNDSVAHNNLGNVLAALGDLGAASREYASALRIRPDYANAEANWAVSLLDARRAAEAIPHFEHAIKLSPTATLENDLGRAMALANRMPDAIRHFEAALRLEAGREDVRLNLGDALMTLGSLERAKREYEAVLQLNPASASAHHNLAVLLMQMGRPADALGHFEETVRLLPKSAMAHHEYAMALGGVGRTADARAQEELALRLQPDFVEAREFLASLRGQ